MLGRLGDSNRSTSVLLIRGGIEKPNIGSQSMMEGCGTGTDQPTNKSTLLLHDTQTSSRRLTGGYMPNIPTTQPDKKPTHLTPNYSSNQPNPLKKAKKTSSNSNSGYNL